MSSRPTWLVALYVLVSGCGGSTNDSSSGAPSELSDSTVLEATLEADDSSSGSVESPETPLLELSYRERKGRRLFLSQCAVCHGTEGEGDGFNAFNLEPRPRDLTDAAYMQELSDEAIREVIARGGRGMNKSILMPAYGETLTRIEIADLVSFVRYLSTSNERSK